MSEGPLGIAELRERYARGEASPSEVVGEALRTIERLDPQICAFRTTTPERALAHARVLDERLARDRAADALGQLPLLGIPVAVKELVDVADVEITAGSRVLEGRVARADAAVVARLRAAGAIVVGVTRSHEFGWGVTTQHETLGGTRNPSDPSRVPGGSSGGSAAAVASGMVPMALGTDTAGSVRIPASFCGVVGLRPTAGTVPRDGVLPLAPSLDEVGVLARSTRDAGRVGAVIGSSGAARADCVPRQPVLGVCPDLVPVALDPGQEEAWAGAIAAAREVGTVQEIAVPRAARAHEALATIQAAEARWWHVNVLGAFPRRADAYGADVRARLGAASGVSLADYLAAWEARRRLTFAFAAAFERVHAIIAPIAATGPSAIATPDLVSHRGRDVPLRDVTIPFAAPQALAGLPTCAVPAAIGADGLPVGVQLACAPGRDEVCLHLASLLADALGVDPGWSIG